MQPQRGDDAAGTAEEEPGNAASARRRCGRNGRGGAGQSSLSPSTGKAHTAGVGLSGRWSGRSGGPANTTRAADSALEQ